MRLEPEVKRENCKIAVGSAILSVAVGVVFFALGKFDYTVAIGSGIGFLLAVGNFFFMSVGVARALEERDESATKLKLRSSYTTRTFAILAVVAASLLLDWINPVPVLLSVFYANIIIKGTNFWNTFVLKKGSEAAREVAAQTLSEVKSAMRINYFEDAELIRAQSEKYEAQ